MPDFASLAAVGHTQTGCGFGIPTANAPCCARSLSVVATRS